MANEQIDVVGSLEEIELVKDLEFAVVPGFEPGKSVRIGSLSAGDMIEWSEASEGEAKRTAGLRLIVKSLVDKDGLRYAMKNEPKSIQVLKARGHKVTESLVKAILKLNGMEVKQQDVAKKD